MSLRPLMDAAEVLAVKDRRTVERRLAQLRVPVVRLGDRLYFSGEVLDAALSRLTQPKPVSPGWVGTVAAPDERLWD